MQMHAKSIKRWNLPACFGRSMVAASAGVALVVASRLLRRGFDRLQVALEAPLPEPAFVAVAEIVAASGGCWLAVGTLCIVLAEAPWGGSGVRLVARRFVPRCWRAAILAAVGTGLLTGPALASATSAVLAPGDPPPHQPRNGALAVLDGLPLPDRASGGWRNRSTVVVARGDCLWTLAAKDLPSTASDASIARHVERWYRANADVIGPDPDLLLPGARLHAPSR